MIRYSGTRYQLSLLLKVLIQKWRENHIIELPINDHAGLHSSTISSYGQRRVKSTAHAQQIDMKTHPRVTEVPIK